MRGLALSLALGLALSAGCARTLPPQPASAALYRDLQRLVGLAETGGWEIDRIEIRGLLQDTLMSVCRVDPDARDALLAWLDQHIEEQGGPVERAYANRGKKIKPIKGLLTLTRIRMVLEEAVEVAPEDCPFWLQPRSDFTGRQIADGRWQVSFGGGGKGILVSQDGRQDIYFGGAGRVLIGRAIGQRWSLLGGAEAGASASFPKDEEGDRGNLVLGVDLVTPAVLRYRLVNSYIEAEAGYLARVTEENTKPVHGMHIGVAYGGRASRRRWFFPGAVFGISYERTFPRASQGEPLQTLKLGFRVAIDIDF